MDREPDDGPAESAEASVKKPSQSVRLARSAARDGDWSTALVHFQTAAAEDPENPRVLEGLGRALRKLKLPAEAEAVYRRLLEFEPTNAAAQLAISQAEWDQGRRTDAVSDLQTAADGHPAGPRMELSLGIKLISQMRIDEAEIVLRRVIAAEPGNAAALRGLGRCAQFGGDEMGALAMFRAADASEPGDPATKSAIRRLEADQGVHDWKSDVRDAIAVLNASDSERGDRLWAGQILVAYGVTDLVEQALAPLEKTTPVVRRLLQMARQLDRMGLSQPSGAATETTDPETEELDALTGFTERLTPGAETLVLVFSGGAQRAFLSLDVIHRILRTTGASLVYLRDLQRTRYLGGVVGLGDDFGATTEAFRAIVARSGARRLLMIGNCTGCSGALRYGLALSAEAVLGISPRIFSAAVLKGLPAQGAAKVAALRKSAGRFADDLPSLYLGATAAPRVTLIAGVGMEPEASFARDMAAKVSGVVSIEVPTTFKECLGDILARGLLTPLFSSFVADGAVAPEILESLSRPAPEEVKAPMDANRSGAEGAPSIPG